MFPLFSKREKEDKATHRLILNLQKINENVVYQHFKMDNVSTFLNIIRQDSYMASTDLLDAYYTVPVLCMDQKYCYFKFREIYINTHAYQMVSYQLQEY